MREDMIDGLVVDAHVATYIRDFVLLYHYDTPMVFIVNINTCGICMQ